MSNVDLSKITSAKDLIDAVRIVDKTIVVPIDVDKIAKLIGFIVKVESNDSDMVGRIDFSISPAVITINNVRNSYEPRRRFTIAHEIAHYILHKNKADGFVDNLKSMNRDESYWDRYEYEANEFAAQLLMPVEDIVNHGKIVVKSIREESGDDKINVGYFITKMADLFAVSRPAMEYRLRRIGAIK